MPYESLSGLSTPDVPELSGCIASAGDEDVLIWAERQTVGRWFRRQAKVSDRFIIGWYLKTLPHHIASVVTKLHHTDASLNVPEHAGHVTGRGDDLAVVDKATAGEIARVSAELAGPFD